MTYTIAGAACSRDVLLLPRFTGTAMKLAFVLFKYFPYGGLQRDMVRMASACQELGYEIHVYTLSWQGDVPRGFHVHLLPAHGLRNFVRYRSFIRLLQQALTRHPVDAVVGFNRISGLDVYYAADPCFRQEHVENKPYYVRFLARYRFFMHQEEAVFGAASKTLVLMISDLQLKYFKKYYGIDDARIRMLPPGISKDRMAPANRAEVRAGIRQEFGLTDDNILLLSVGSGFDMKGFDRGLLAVAALPAELRTRVRVFVIGQDKQGPVRRLMQRLGIADIVSLFPGRDDIPRFLQGADLLLHPARHENAGMIIIEAIIAGLPVLTTATCGYAFHVEAAAAGRVVASPFRQSVLDNTLHEMLTSGMQDEWSANGIRYSQIQDLYSLHEKAANIIHDRVLAHQHTSPL
jgi:UDP-glucose:(heptosyl)LPS alpha-1,3-glucosyltransferase